MLARALGRQLIGTVVAVLAGWFVALLLLEMIGLIDRAQQGQHPLDALLMFGGALAWSYVAVWFIIPVWLFLVVPLYLFIPASVSLWQWPFPTLLGTAVGFLAITCFFGVHYEPGDRFLEAWGLHVVGAVTGAITGLAASVTRHRFKQASNHAMERTADRRTPHF